MLKFEKILKTLDITITVRKREGFFSRNLLQALAIAIGLHALAVILFHVGPLKIMGSQLSILPVVVDADIGLPMEGVEISQFDVADTYDRFIREPRNSSPNLPNVAVSPSMLSSLSERAKIVLPPLPHFLESDIYSLDFLMFQARNQNQDPVQIKISGLLADRLLADDPLAGAQVKDIEDYNAVYNVQVDDRSGTIFWYEAKHREKNDRLELYAEDLLKRIHFEKREDSFVTIGEVEIQFLSKAHNDRSIY